MTELAYYNQANFLERLDVLRIKLESLEGYL